MAASALYWIARRLVGLIAVRRRSNAANAVGTGFTDDTCVAADRHLRTHS